MANGPLGSGFDRGIESLAGAIRQRRATREASELKQQQAEGARPIKEFVLGRAFPGQQFSPETLDSVDLKQLVDLSTKLAPDLQQPSSFDLLALSTASQQLGVPMEQLAQQVGVGLGTPGERLPGPGVGLELESVSVSPRGGVTTRLAPTKTEEQARSEARKEGLKVATKKEFENAKKLGGALRSIAVVTDQFNQAFPSEGRTAFEQRIAGIGASIGAATGLVEQPELRALQKNARLEAIQVIRAFGEVGNLSATEQKSAIDAFTQTNLTEDERAAIVKQIAEFAIGRMASGAREEFLRDPENQKLIQAFGVNTDPLNIEVPDFLPSKRTAEDPVAGELSEDEDAIVNRLLGGL